MSEDKKEVKMVSVELSVEEWNAVLSDYDIAIKSPAGNVDVLYARKLNLINKIKAALEG